MARYSLLEKLAGHAEPEVDGTALLKLAEAYGRDPYEPDFDGSAIVKLAAAYGQTKEAGIKDKLLSMVGAERKRSGASKVMGAAAAAGLGGLAVSQADKIKALMTALKNKLFPEVPHPVKQGVDTLFNVGKKAVDMNQKVLNTPMFGDKTTAVIKGKKLADFTASGVDPDKAAAANKYIMSVLDALKGAAAKVGG